MEAKDYIDEIRSNSQLTQAEISERTGIPQPTISKIERGEVKDVMSRNYRALQELHRSLGLGSQSAQSATPSAQETARLMGAAFQAGTIKDQRVATQPRRADDRARDDELATLRVATKPADSTTATKGA